MLQSFFFVCRAGTLLALSATRDALASSNVVMIRMTKSFSTFSAAAS